MMARRYCDRSRKIWLCCSRGNMLMMRSRCQVALEEFMACAVGGCAGCTVLVRTPAGPAMKRVCVEVFDAYSVF
jgi:hypothetical protein